MKGRKARKSLLQWGCGGPIEHIVPSLNRQCRALGHSEPKYPDTSVWGQTIPPLDVRHYYQASPQKTYSSYPPSPTYLGTSNLPTGSNIAVGALPAINPANWKFTPIPSLVSSVADHHILALVWGPQLRHFSSRDLDRSSFLLSGFS